MPRLAKTTLLVMTWLLLPAGCGEPAGSGSAGDGAAHPASAPSAPAAEQGPRITGTVELAPQFAALAGKGPLFIIARGPQSQGMPVAVIRADGATFPYAFSMGPENIPLQVDNKAELLTGELKLYARLGLSGQFTGGPGDIECAPLLVKGGGPAVTLRLDTQRK